MSAVSEDELAYLLALVRALLGQLAVALEEVLREELGELGTWALRVLIDLVSQELAEEQGVGEATIDGVQSLQESHQEGVEGC